MEYGVCPSVKDKDWGQDAGTRDSKESNRGLQEKWVHRILFVHFQLRYISKYFHKKILASLSESKHPRCNEMVIKRCKGICWSSQAEP